MYKFLVSHDGTKYVVNVSSKTLDELTASIRRTCNISDQAQFHIQYFEEDFGEWVQLQDPSGLPDKAKLQTIDAKSLASGMCEFVFNV